MSRKERTQMAWANRVSRDMGQWLMLWPDLAEFSARDMRRPWRTMKMVLAGRIALRQEEVMQGIVTAGYIEAMQACKSAEERELTHRTSLGLWPQYRAALQVLRPHFETDGDAAETC